MSIYSFVPLALADKYANSEIKAMRKKVEIE